MLKKYKYFIIVYFIYFNINFLLASNFWLKIFTKQPVNLMSAFGDSFITIDQPMTIIITLALLLNNIVMYLFLRLLNIKRTTAFIVGLIYGFTPIIVLRIPDIIYISYYIFPLLGSILIKLTSEKNYNKKIFYSLLLSIILSLVVLTNIHIAILISILSIILITSFFIFYKKKTLIFIQTQTKFFFISLFISFLTLIPWINELVQYLDRKLFIRSLNNIQVYLSPGIIILISYTILIVFRKKFPEKIIQLIKPYYFSSLIFIILVLAQYLFKIGTINPVIIIFIFSACVSTAMIINRLMENKYNRKKFYILFGLIIFFSIYQVNGIENLKKTASLAKIYPYFKNNGNESLFNIPFSIHDEYQYFGDYKEDYFLQPAKFNWSAIQELIDFKQNNNQLMLIAGWDNKEPNGRWSNSKMANILLKANKTGNYKLGFTANTWIQKQKATIYIDKHKITDLILTEQMHSYEFQIPWELKKDLHLVTFKFSKLLQPSKYLPNNQDQRYLSAFFTEIKLK